MFTDVAAGSSYEDFCHDEIVPYKLEKAPIPRGLRMWQSKKDLELSKS